jgi:hypothetical protein
LVLIGFLKGEKNANHILEKLKQIKGMLNLTLFFVCLIIFNAVQLLDRLAQEIWEKGFICKNWGTNRNIGFHRINQICKVPDYEFSQNSLMYDHQLLHEANFMVF